MASHPFAHNAMERKLVCYVLDKPKWVFDLIRTTFGRQINLLDLGACPKQFHSKTLADSLEEEWRSEVKKQKPSFARSTVRVFGLELVPVILLAVVKQVGDGLIKPLILANLLQYLSDPNAPHWHGVLNCAVMIVSSSIYLLLHYPWVLMESSWRLRVRNAWTAMVYRKTLRLKNTALQRTTAGQIVNLISNDSEQFFGWMVGYTISEPIVAVIGVYLCYHYVGSVTFIGLAIVAFLFVFNYFGGKVMEGYYKQLQTKTDHRVSVMTEILKFMRTIKMYAWEEHFHNLVSKARREEMEQVKNLKYFQAFFFSVFEVATSCTMFAMFVVYAMQGNSLNAHKVYAVITIFTSVIYNVTYIVSDNIVIFFKIMASSQRIQDFLMLEEVGENRRHILDSNYNRSDTVGEYPVEVNKATVKWEMTKNPFTLEEICLRVKRGELLTVIGSVGSGKSTFLASLLNEPSIVSGSVNIAGKVAYAAQEPWCFNDTIEANILFGQPYNKRKFCQVIEACALRVDLDSMPHREKTLVGERGVILSGGQKARVALARALYSDADIYLLDDPLSAVDAEVAKHIFEQCIEGYLRDKTVVLVTHQVQFIKNSSKILVLDKGQPLAYGTYEHVLQSDSKLLDFIQKSSELDKDNSEEEAFAVEYKKQISTVSEQDSEYTGELDPEEMESGSVSFEHYRNYFKSGASWWLMLTAFVSIIAAQWFINWSHLLVSQWTNAEDAQVRVEVTSISVKYFLIIVCYVFFHTLKWVSLHRMCINASTNLHNRVFHSLMRAPIAFFDTTPTGRVLNRFTKDLKLIDNMFSDMFGTCATMLMECIGTLVIIACFEWRLILPAVVIYVISKYLRSIYAHPSRDLQRLESTLRSPVINHTHLSVGGLNTIRAFQAESLLTEQFYYFLDSHSNGFFTMWTFRHLFALIIDVLCNFYVFCAAVCLVLFHGDIQSGTAGLILALAFELPGPIRFGVRRSVELETQMISVERLEKYTKLEPEGPLKTNYRLPENWPSSGRIEFDHVSLSYDGKNEVLKDLTFEVRGGEKVSIVGRTGAGKSSVLAALFRMVEVRGRVAIDGVPSNALGLNQLRSALAIIPQEPMAFVGSVRANLDPLSCHSDGELWQALRAVQLASTVEQWEGQLDYELSEGGTNLSVGQRQLVCLARALLRGNQILVLDEATANVDHHTDQLIQGTIRECFEHCTVITIAHRLHTIIDSNRVLVLDAGRLVQFDTSRNLLAAKTGIFYNLVQQTGPEMAAKLENAVFNADNKNDLFN